MLAPYRGAGIQKKAKKKQLSHAQRLRHERGLQRGEAVQDQLQSKVEDARAKLKKRQGRRALWEDVNGLSNEEVRKAIKAPGRFDSLDDDEDVSDDIQPFHGDTEIKVISGVLVPSFATGQSMSLAVGPSLAPSNKKPGTFGVSSAQPASTSKVEHASGAAGAAGAAELQPGTAETVEVTESETLTSAVSSNNVVLVPPEDNNGEIT